MRQTLKIFRDSERCWLCIFHIFTLHRDKSPVLQLPLQVSLVA